MDGLVPRDDKLKEVTLTGKIWVYAMGSASRVVNRTTNCINGSGVRFWNFNLGAASFLCLYEELPFLDAKDGGPLAPTSSISSRSMRLMLSNGIAVSSYISSRAFRMLVDMVSLAKIDKVQGWREEERAAWTRKFSYTKTGIDIHERTRRGRKKGEVLAFLE